jgi:Mce-associated membrane protein
MTVRHISDTREVTRRRNARVAIVRPRTPVRGPSEPKTAAPKQRAKRAQRSTGVLLLGLALAAALAALAVTGRQWYEHRRLDDAHQAALAAARQATVDFVSISATSVDHDLQRIAGGATGDFADEFNRGLRDVRTAVMDNEVQSQGTALRAGLISGDLDSAVVIVAVDATVKNKGAPDGRLSHYRIQVDMALDPDTGRWLVSRLQFVG